MARTVKTLYISDGPSNTGGFFHEQFWFEKTNQWLRDVHHLEVQSESIRPDTYHSGFFNIVSWWWLVFTHAKKDWILTPVRCALPVLWRALFSSNSVGVVIHSMNHDKISSKKWLQWYYVVVFFLLRRKRNSYIVAVAPYWKDYLVKVSGLPSERVVYLPNLFDPADYTPYVCALKKERSICLGMWSTKVHKMLFELAARLAHNGYVCFFTSPQDLVSFGAYGYHIAYCPDEVSFREKVAQASFTLAYSQTPEGWSRVAHESFLLGTPVIGHDNAGLGDLIRAANGFLADNVMEVMELVGDKPGWKPSTRFEQTYHVSRAFHYLESIRTLLPGWKG
jgi:glycosyltransferase involved in cell wall biosynthesis